MPMTVKDLIEELKKYEGDRRVFYQSDEEELPHVPYSVTLMLYAESTDSFYMDGDIDTPMKDDNFNGYLEEVVIIS